MSKSQRRNSEDRAVFVLLPCLLLCLVVVLGVALTQPQINYSMPEGWVKTDEAKVQEWNSTSKEYWETNESEWVTGDAPILLYEYKMLDENNKLDANQPIGIIGVYEVYKNSLLPGLNIIPPWGQVILPEGELPASNKSDIVKDYVKRAKGWWDSNKEAFENLGWSYNDKGEKQKISVEMPIIQVIDLKNGGSAARLLYITKKELEDGTIKSWFQDAIIIFEENKLIEIVIQGQEYGLNSNKEEGMIEFIKKNYPNLDFPK